MRKNNTSPGRRAGETISLRSDRLRKGSQLPRRRRADADRTWAQAMGRRQGPPRPGAQAQYKRRPRSPWANRAPRAAWSVDPRAVDGARTVRPTRGALGEIGEITITQPVPTLRSGRERKRARPPRRPKNSSESTFMSRFQSVSSLRSASRQRRTCACFACKGADFVEGSRFAQRAGRLRLLRGRTSMDVLTAKAGLLIRDVPFYERDRMYGQSNLQR